MNRSGRRLSLVIALLMLATACSHKAKVPTPKVSRTSTPTRPAPPPAPSKARVPEVQPAPSVKESEPVQVPAAAAAPSVINPAPSALPDSPTIRIGLTTSAREVRISSQGDFYLLEKVPEATRQLVRGDLRVRVERGTGESAVRYFVQVASFSKPEMAEELRKKLAARISAPVEVHENRELARYQVRVGEFTTRAEALEFATSTIRAAGLQDFIIVKENAAVERGEPTLALRGTLNLFRVNRAGFLFFPHSSANLLFFDGKPYRGFLELTLNKNGAITVVNQLEIEEYLLGVVPAEINPDSYPEAAALAAQAVAARTYALKNTGRFRSEGFDLTADIRSQVYIGFSGEKEASDEAVRQTFGLAIYYQNQLIDAMYSSTCGGRTEDYSNVFEGPPVPYLKGVACAVEAGLQREVQLSVKGSHALSQPVYSDEGVVANRGLELAHILGINGPDSLTAAYLADPPTGNEALRWIVQAGRVAGRDSAQDPPAAAGDLTRRAAFIRYAAEYFFGAQEIERRISGADADYYLANIKDGDTVPPSDRKALAYLIQQNLWRANPENRIRPLDPIRRADALLLLMGWIESAQPQVLRKGVFAGRANGARGDEADDASASVISIKSGNKVQQFPLSNQVCLYLTGKGASTPAENLKMIGNEKLSFHLAGNGSIDFLEVELNPTGTASDRYSPVATWNVTIPRTALAEKLRSLTDGMGEFKDLRPWKLGTSGRAVQIYVIGSRRSVVLNGYKVRNALGLRDTLFTISRSFNADGSIEAFTFHGRGWGHGVGLCQVGAFGMARAGRSYEEILKTYYQGVEIRKAY